MEKQTYKVLMLEDTASDAELIMNNLKHADVHFELHQVEDRKSYLLGLSDFRPDIVLSDYGLPNYTGLAAYADMRLKGFDLPFIMVTGSLPDELAVDCLKAGIDDYVLKDRLSRLPEAIQGVMNKRRLEQDRTRFMKQLVKSQHNLEAAERLAQVGNWEWDVKSDRVLWSKQLFDLFGLETGTLPSRELFFQLIHEEDRPLVYQEMERLLSGEVHRASMKSRIVTPDGVIKMVNGEYGTNMDDNTVRSIKVFGTIQDITELHSTEQSLRELTEQLEQRVKDRTKELEAANDMLARRNMEMTDSLNYAKMIQRALLSDLTSFSQAFPSSFVLWMPKDIVSGDFYWHYHQEDVSYVAAVDCTGHGVPGALMSAIGHQLLDRIIVERGCAEPEEILRELDKGVVDALFQQEGQLMQDGMDIALCRIDRKTREVCFSGALRPLFIRHQDEVKEIVGSKAAIGSAIVSNNNKLFFQTCVACSKGDVIYLTTDGFYSQFGGEFGKKMMKNRFIKMLADIGHLPLADQKLQLDIELSRWRGFEEQVDDILIIGIQL
jgi:PAS domain S-box-containing protein